GTAGDLLCRVQVETPVNLSNEQKDLLMKFQESLTGEKHSPQKKSWFEGVKRFFEDI
ncbi:MAG: molecular chaperone DnaJ, partial [Thalassolituus sp.]|nr:molecular chaperone DnaJ [Thalassolituus sp.]